MNMMIQKKRESLKRSIVLVSILMFGILVFASPLFSPSPSAFDESLIFVKQTMKNVANDLVQLFDIKMELENSVLDRSTDLRANISFASFGNMPTPINLLFKVLDEKSDTVYAEKDSITVETEKVLVKEFPNLEVLPGKYELVLSTNYNGDVNDDFRQSFEVKDNSIIGVFSMPVMIIAITLCVGAGLLLLYRLFGADWF
jgi:hypothetical protein